MTFNPVPKPTKSARVKKKKNKQNSEGAEDGSRQIDRRLALKRDPRQEDKRPI